MRVHVPHRVEQRCHLPLPGFDDARIGVARRSDAECRRQVEIFFSVGVPHVHALGALPDDWPRTIRLNERQVARFVALQELKDLAGGHGVLTTESHPPLVRRPDELVHLELETDRERVGDDFLDQLKTGDGRLACGNFF